MTTKTTLLFMEIRDKFVVFAFVSLCPQSILAILKEKRTTDFMNFSHIKESGSVQDFMNFSLIKESSSYDINNMTC